VLSTPSVSGAGNLEHGDINRAIGSVVEHPGSRLFSRVYHVLIVERRDAIVHR